MRDGYPEPFPGHTVSPDRDGYPLDASIEGRVEHTHSPVASISGLSELSSTLSHTIHRLNQFNQSLINQQRERLLLINYPARLCYLPINYWPLNRSPLQYRAARRIFLETAKWSKREYARVVRKIRVCLDRQIQAHLAPPNKLCQLQKTLAFCQRKSRELARGSLEFGSVR